MTVRSSDAVDGFLRGHRKLILDRDAKCTRTFQALLASGGVEPVFTPPSSPNGNAYAERFVRSIKEECLGRMVFFGEAALPGIFSFPMSVTSGHGTGSGLSGRTLRPKGKPSS